MTSPRAEAAIAELGTRNGECEAGKRAGSPCSCDLYEPAGHADGFAVCVCTHTKWAHAVSWVPGRQAALAGVE